MTTAKEKAQLRREWNRILAEEGLDEIETSGGRLKSTLPAARYVERALTDGRENYYEMARHYAKHARLRGRSGEAWKLHSEGVGYRQIAARLGCSKRTVEGYINDGKKAMAAWFSGGGVEAGVEGVEGTSAKKKRKNVLALLSDLEGALWQQGIHGYLVRR